jgi:DNA-binding beta-propeller fold protein YncE
MTTNMKQIGLSVFLLFCTLKILSVRPCEVIYSSKYNKLYVVSEDPASILQLDPDGQNMINIVDLPQKPTGAVLSQTGEELFVTLGGFNGQVAEVDIRQRKVYRLFQTGGHTPTAPVLSPDGHILYVSNRFNNKIAAIDIKKGKVSNYFQVVREPNCQAISRDGKYLFVGNFLPAVRSNEEKVNAVISVIDLLKGTIGKIDLPNGANAIGGLAISPDGKYIYATHILAMFQMPTTQIERGWINSNALSIIDIEKKICITTVLLDDVDLGFSNPWAVSCSSDGKYLLVTSMGGNELSVIDRNILHNRITTNISTNQSQENPYPGLAADLSFMNSLKRIRIKLPGYGPKSLALMGNRAYVSEIFSGTLCGIDFTAPKGIKVLDIMLGEKNLMTDPVKYGEMLFNSSENCFQQWQSCASCHPNARIDGLNWDLMNDGIGNPKNVRSMLNVHVTPPAMSLGVRATAEAAVRSGMRYILFAANDEEKATAIDAYLKALKPEVSPNLVNGNLSKKAMHGKEIFEQEGCAVCHPSPLFTNLKKYNMQSGKDMDKDKDFDTPGLVEVWRTAPYLYDGSALNMYELIKLHNPDGSKKLSDKNLAELVEYILSL